MIQYYSTLAGILELTIENERLTAAVFIDNSSSNLATIADIPPLFLQGTQFQLKVWRATQQIPAGKTTTYKDLASAIGHPGSWRAVANALANNKIAYFIPCHRVVGSNGKLAGYKWGIERKKVLLKIEGAIK